MDAIAREVLPYFQDKAGASVATATA
jgi:hypothetical protein